MALYGCSTPQQIMPRNSKEALQDVILVAFALAVGLLHGDLSRSASATVWREINHADTAGQRNYACIIYHSSLWQICEDNPWTGECPVPYV